MSSDKPAASVPRVAALYRYPVKGFTPEPCESLTVLEEGRIAGDRVLGIRFADAGGQRDDWCKKQAFLSLMNTPGLARLSLKFDHQRLHLSLSLGDMLITEAGLDQTGRQRIIDMITQYVLDLPENPLQKHLERLPIELVGDGITPRYQDSSAGRATLHGRGSLLTVAGMLGTCDVDERRFRSNIAVEGLNPWEEQGWMGKVVTVGEVRFRGFAAKERCLATHANPETGARDLPVLKALLNTYDTKKPVFAISLMPENSGIIRIGDPVFCSDV
ncbi:MAG: MOSC domain-containing protein [Methylomicrobium sp.]|nr:MOSC domain-containing protein [Methylomicrobium sp.]